MLIALGIGFSGCSSALRLTGFGGIDDDPAVAAPAVNPGPQKMQAGDHINVTVYNEASLSGTYAVDPAGFVTIPRAGRLRAAGLTPSELADLLVKKFRGEYLNNPKVTVAVI
ncbi:MAG: polysaccharide biosynthesis/export family protein [Xanthobacteraceae bacterium]|nr:polysaccharide biosynthesis/export family protein [Xanthobacteraceae bacterium]